MTSLRTSFTAIGLFLSIPQLMSQAADLQESIKNTDHDANSLSLPLNMAKIIEDWSLIRHKKLTDSEFRDYENVLLNKIINMAKNGQVAANVQKFYDVLDLYGSSLTKN